MISHKRWNALAKQLALNERLLHSFFISGGVMATAGSDLNTYSVFSLSTPEGDNPVPKMTVQPVEDSPCVVYTCHTEVKAGNFLAYPIPNDRPSLVRGAVTPGSVCGPVTGYSITSPGNAMFYCLGQYDTYSLVLQNNYVHQSICTVKTATLPGAVGTCTIMNRVTGSALVNSTVEVPFVNKTGATKNIGDIIKIKATIGSGFVLSQ